MLGIVARFTRTPFVGSISGLGPVFSQINRREKLRFKVVIFIYRFIFRPKSAVVICQSEHDKNILLNKAFSFLLIAEASRAFLRDSTHLALWCSLIFFLGLRGFLGGTATSASTSVSYSLNRIPDDKILSSTCCIIKASDFPA